MALKKGNGQTVPFGTARDKPDQKTLEKIKEIFHLLASTVSALKLFPAHHSTVKKFKDDLTGKLGAFLDERWELEVEVEKDRFLHQSEIVYKDENLLKSLPYFFFKDGVRKLSFQKGLTPAELGEFLEVVKKDSLSPPEESDIVVSLWEKDFENIRYKSPDEFIESKIETLQKSPLNFSVDRTLLYTGKIQLNSEDMEEIYKRSLAFQLKKQEDFLDVADLMASLDKKEKHILEAMLHEERKISAEEDFLSVLFELLHLEERPEEFLAILEYLEKHHQELILKGDFFHALSLFRQIQELKNILSYKSSNRSEELEKFLVKIRDKNSEEAIKEIARKEKIEDPFYFFEYLKLLGPKAILLSADLFEEIKRPEFRSAAFSFLQEMSQRNLSLLVPLAHDQRPVLSKAIIALLAQMKDKKAISSLAAFRHSKSLLLKLEAIRALGRFEDVMANKILIVFLQDEDEEIRIEAAENLRFLNDKTSLNQVIHMALDKAFHDKSLREKSAVFNFLGRSKTEEASAFFQSILEKSGASTKAKQEEASLCAVRALEIMATPKALEALEKGAKDSNKKISSACQEALQKISSANNSSLS